MNNELCPIEKTKIKFNNKTIREAVKIVCGKKKSKHLKKDLCNKYGHISNWDTSEVTDMKGLFKKVRFNFNEDIGSWDVSNVTNMEEMFYCAYSFDNDGSINKAS